MFEMGEIVRGDSPFSMTFGLNQEEPDSLVWYVRQGPGV
jgi:hypothetical protein